MDQTLPLQGAPWDRLRERMVEMAAGDVKWADGKAAV